MSEGKTARFLGRPGNWPGVSLRLEEGGGARRIEVRGTGEVSLAKDGATHTGVVPVPQVHRMISIIVQADLATVSVPPLPNPTDKSLVRIELRNGNGDSIEVSRAGEGSVARFDIIHREVIAVVEELFPKQMRPPGFFSRLLGKS